MKVKVATCWDDGVATDIYLSRIFRKYGAKATFNLIPGAIGETTVYPYWRKFQSDKATAWDRGYCAGRVGKDLLQEVYGGFQLASHCWMHETPDKLSPAEFLDAAKRARLWLEDTFQQECPGFAWPCGVTTQECADLLRNAGFLYGRNCRSVDDLRENTDPLLLASSCHFMEPLFWERFQTAKKSTGLFYFWGHSYEMKDFAGRWNYMDSLIHELSTDPDVEWVDVKDLPGLLKG